MDYAMFFFNLKNNVHKYGAVTDYHHRKFKTAVITTKKPPSSRIRLQKVRRRYKIFRCSSECCYEFSILEGLRILHSQNVETLQYWNNKKLNEAFRLKLLRVQCTCIVINNDFRRRIPRSQTKKESEKERIPSRM